mmetsp:Transcript_106340/g.297700  ORF Transcript_106340/g.297700 Transcript_106340/m.297700 type:complete len:355 (+) Transcript_106340:885-1949(+)
MQFLRVYRCRNPLLQTLLEVRQQLALGLEGLRLVVVPYHDICLPAGYGPEGADLVLQHLDGLLQPRLGAQCEPALQPLQAGHLDLQLRGWRLRPQVEDLKHYSIPVVHLDAGDVLPEDFALLLAPLRRIRREHRVVEDRLQVAALRGREARVEEDDVARVARNVERHLLHLAFSDISVGVDVTDLDDACLRPLPLHGIVLPGLLVHVELVVALRLAPVEVPALGHVRRERRRLEPPLLLQGLRVLPRGVVPTAFRLLVRTREDVPAQRPRQAEGLHRVVDEVRPRLDAAGDGQHRVHDHDLGLRPVQAVGEGVLVGEPAPRADGRPPPAQATQDRRQRRAQRADEQPRHRHPSL